MKEIIIRNALKSEFPYIQEQRINAYREHSNVIPSEHWTVLKKTLSSDGDGIPGVELIVAEVDGNIVSSVVLFPAKTNAYQGYIEELDYPEIRMLAVASEVRGKGVAKALINECIERTKAKGFTSIGLHTGEFMESAIRLYERLGFVRIPQFDFEPANDGIIVRAYQLSFDENDRNL